MLSYRLFFVSTSCAVSPPTRISRPLAGAMPLIALTKFWASSELRSSPDMTDNQVKSPEAKRGARESIDSGDTFAKPSILLTPGVAAMSRANWSKASRLSGWRISPLA